VDASTPTFEPHTLAADEQRTRALALAARLLLSESGDVGADRPRHYKASDQWRRGDWIVAKGAVCLDGAGVAPGERSRGKSLPV